MDWVSIVATQPISLWRDVPSAMGLTLACTHGELAALIAALPSARTDPARVYGALRCEVRTRSGEVRAIRLYLSVVHSTQPGRLHTGNGAGAWIEVGDEIRIAGFETIG